MATAALLRQGALGAIFVAATVPAQPSWWTAESSSAAADGTAADDAAADSGAAYGAAAHEPALPRGAGARPPLGASGAHVLLALG